MAQNALLNGMAGALPSLDLAGPTVDDDVMRIIRRYGAEAVKKSVADQTKGRRGRPPLKDWPEFHEYLKQDAADWLSGKDPFSIRSNYWIAKQAADKLPGNSAVSTQERIERKLRKQREIWMLIHAENIGKNGYPHSAYLRAVLALKEKSPHECWELTHRLALEEISEYEMKHGRPPPAAMSMDEIKEANRARFAVLAKQNADGEGGELSKFLARLSSISGQIA